MNIVICGAGEVGRHTAEVLGEGGHNITIIDVDPRRLAGIEDVMDVRILPGNGADASVLIEAGCNKADLFVAATRIDEINLLSASIAAGIGAGRTIARVHHAAYFEQHGIDYAHHFGIDHLVCPEHTTALAIAQALRNPGALAVERFARGMIELQQLPVGQDVPAVGKALSDLAMPAAARVAVIQRGPQAFIPDAATVVQQDDIVTVIGEAKAIDRTRALFQSTDHGRKRVMILGGTPLSVWLSRALRGREFSVRLFELDQARAEELANKLDWITVLRADPMDADTLMLERIDQADAFIAATNDDEHNVLAAARAKTMGARSAVAVQQRSTYLHLLKHIGIDRAYSPRTTAVDEIQRLLIESGMRRMAVLAEGVVDLFEIRVPKAAASIIGVPLKQIQFPSRTIIAAIQRNDRVHVGGADDTIEVGDTVVVIAASGKRSELEQMFGLR